MAKMQNKLSKIKSRIIYIYIYKKKNRKKHVFLSHNYFMFWSNIRADHFKKIAYIYINEASRTQKKPNGFCI